MKTLFDEKPIYIQCFNRDYKYSSNIILYIFNNSIKDLKYFAGQNACGLDDDKPFIISNHKRIYLKEGDYLVRLVSGEYHNSNDFFHRVLVGEKEESIKHHLKTYQFLVMDKFTFDLLFYEATN